MWCQQVTQEYLNAVTEYIWDAHQDRETICFQMDAGGSDVGRFYMLLQGPMFTGETMSVWPALGKADCMLSG